MNESAGVALCGGVADKRGFQEVKDHLYFRGSDLINKNLHTNKATSTTEECKVYIKATYPLGKTTPDVH